MKQLKVFGDVRAVPLNFPGTRGTVRIIRIAPPERSGEYLGIPAGSAAFDTAVVVDQEDPRLPFSPFRMPTEETIRRMHANPGGGQTIEGVSCFLPNNDKPDVVLMSLRESDVTFGIWWREHTLHFRVAEREASFDCAAARGLEGFAQFHWTPERIWVDYAVADSSGNVLRNSAIVTVRN